jgi:hypothetical protein
MQTSIYTSGAYLEKNPSWHVEDSPYKAKQIVNMLDRHNLHPKTVCEIGCGAGEILRVLQGHLSPECLLWGYEISPQAYELCRTKENTRLRFLLRDFRDERNAVFDLILVIDLLEHLEDYLGFLEHIRSRSEFKMFHIPLDISVQSVLRVSPIMKARAAYGHLHYFTKESALKTLSDAGYELLDYCYTAGSMETRVTSPSRYAARLARRALFTLHRDLAVRLMGGYSLLVLARSAS